MSLGEDSLKRASKAGKGGGESEKALRGENAKAPRGENEKDLRGKGEKAPRKESEKTLRGESRQTGGEKGGAEREELPYYLL